MSSQTTKPWYRQLWPWLVFLPPALAVVGGFTTLYLVVRYPDAEVCGNYVRDGLGLYPAPESSAVRKCGN